MTKTKPISADQLHSLFESFEFLSFDIVCGVRLENIPNLRRSPCEHSDIRASNLLACIFNGKANYR